MDFFSRFFQKALPKEIETFLQEFYFIRIRNIIHNFFVMDNKQYYNALRKKLKKNENKVQAIELPHFSDFETVRIVYQYSWYSRKAQILYNSLTKYTKQQIDKFKLFSTTMKDKTKDMYHKFKKSQTRKRIKTVLNFIKSYFLFPWYVYKIYKMLQKDRSKK